MNFFIKCIPPKSTAQASTRILKRKDGTRFVGKFANSKGNATQTELMLLLEKYVPDTPYTTPLKVSVTWTYPWRKSEPKKNVARGYMPCTTRPDVDNLCKLLFDCMTRLGFWADDSLIVELNFKKGWGNCNGIGISVEDGGATEVPRSCNHAEELRRLANRGLREAD